MKVGRLIVFFLVVLLFATVASAQIVINEVLPNPGVIDWDGNGTSTEPEDEWVELYNNGTIAVNLIGWNISDDTSIRFTFPSIIINPKSFVVIYGSNATPSLNLRNTYDNVSLYNASGVVVDNHFYNLSSGAIADWSIGRYLDGTNNWFNLSVPTPAGKNDREAPVLNAWLNPSSNNTQLTGTLNITINVTDLANIVDKATVNFNGTTYAMSSSGDLWSYPWNTVNNNDGSYNITVNFNDTIGFSGSDTLLNITTDSTGPVLTSLTCNPNPANVSSSVVCNATITDLAGVNTVSANVTSPDNSVSSVLVSNVNSNYYFTFSGTGQKDLYNVTWWANDSLNNKNTAKTNFTINDVVSPSVTALIPALGSAFNTSSGSVEIVANVTDNIAVDSVRANVTYPNGTSNMLTLTQSTGNKYNNSFIIPVDLIGLYTVSFSANDTSNNVNNTQATNFSITDGTLPVVNTLSCTPNPQVLNASVLCSVNVTDNINITSLNANVTMPNGTVLAQSVVNQTFNFSTILAHGQYNITWEASDAAGNKAIVLTNFTTMNNTPILVQNISDQAFPEDTNLTINVVSNFVDVDGHNITFASAGAANIAVSVNGSNVTFIPSMDFFGIRSVNVTATDQDGTTTSNNFVLNVTAVNDLPQILSPILFNASENDPPFTIDLTAHENDMEDSGTNLDWNVVSFDTSFFSNVFLADSNNDLISIILQPNVNGMRDFVVNLTDTNGGSVQGNVTINVSSFNSVPQFTGQIANQTPNEDTSTLVDISSLLSDTDNATSELIVTTNSSKITVSGQVLNLTYNDQTISNETVLVNVSDGLASTTQTFMVTVNFTNDQPVVNTTSVTVAEDSTASTPLNLTTVASDEETAASALTYAIFSENTAQVDCAISSSQLLQVTPAANFSGQAFCGVTASDGSLTSNPVNITVTVTPVDDPIVFSGTIPNQIINQSSSITLNLTSYWVNVDNDVLTFTASATPNFTISITNGIANISAQQNFLLSNTVVFNVSDVNSSAVSNTVNLSIMNTNLNGPVWTALPTIGFIEEGSNNSFDLDDYVSDIDTPDSQISFSSSPSGANITVTIDSTTHVATFSAVQNFCGQEWTVVTANDSVSVAGQSVLVDVTCVNDLPVVTLNDPANAGTVTTATPLLNWTATDAENGQLTFDVFLSTTNPPTSPIANGISTTTFTTQSLINQQIYYWMVRASDGTNTTNSSVFSFTVVTNNAPVISNQTPSQSTLTGLETGTSQTFSVIGTDPDTSSLTFAFEHLINNVVQTTSTPQTMANGSTASYTLTFNSVGTHTVRVNVSDGVNIPATHTWTVNVVAFNNPPTLSISDVTKNEDDPAFTVDLAQAASDQETSDSSLTYSLMSESNTTVVDCSLSGQTLTCTPQPNQFGTSTVTMNVTDQGGKSASDTFTITVNQVDDLPTITRTVPFYSNPAIAPNTTFAFTVFASDPDTNTIMYHWYLDNQLIHTANSSSFIPNAGSAYIFNSSTMGTFTLRVDVSDGASTTSKTWIILVTDTLQATKFNGASTDLSQLNETELASIDNLVLEVLPYGRITFSSPVDLSNIIDLNNAVIIENNVVGVDTASVPQLNQPASITINNVAVSDPILLFTTEFTNNVSQVSATCPSSRCSNMQVSGATVTFDVSQFSMYSVGDTTSTDLSVPSSIEVGGSNAARGSSVTQSFTISNSGSADITDLGISSSALSDYAVQFSVNGDAFSTVKSNLNISAGSSTSVSVKLTIPTDENTGLHDIGDILFTTASQSASTELLIDPASGLSISRIKVEGDTVSEGGTSDIKPDEDITIKVEVENILAVEIENVEITVTIKDIDDDDDLDEESDDFDLKAGENEEESFDFSIPEDLEDDEYDVVIEVEGRDETGATHREVVEFKLEVDKERHDLRLDADLSTDVVECARRPSVFAEVKNIGSSDEEDVRVLVTSSSLNVNKFSRAVDLDENDDFNVEFTLNLNDAQTGNHQVVVSVFRDKDNKEDEQVFNLDVKECKTQTTQNNVVELSELEKIKKLHQQLLASQVVLPEQPQQITVVEQKSSSNVLLVLLLASLGLIILAGLIMGIIVYSRQE